MKIFTSIKHFDNLKNMLVEEIVGYLRYMRRLHDYNDKEEKTYLLLTRRVAQTDKK